MPAAGAVHGRLADCRLWEVEEGSGAFPLQGGTARRFPEMFLARFSQFLWPREFEKRAALQPCGGITAALPSSVSP